MALGQVAHMQTILADNLRQGIGGLGSRGLEKASHDLEVAKTKYAIGRQRESDRRAAEAHNLGLAAMKRNQMLANNQMAEYNQPIHISMLTPSLGALEHGLWTTEDGNPKDSLLLKFADMWGGKWDLREGSPTRGQLFVGNKAVTRGDVHKNAGPIQAFMTARTGLDHTIRSQEEQIERDFKNGKMDAVEFRKRKAAIENLKMDIPKKMEIANKNIELLGRFTNVGNPLFQGEIVNGLKRWQAKHDSLQKQWADRQNTLIAARSRIEAADAKVGPGVTLPDGKVLPSKEARALYRATYNIPNEVTLQEMEYSSDPAAVEAAAKYRQMLNEKSLSSFFRRLETEGMPQNWARNEAARGSAIDAEIAKYVPGYKPGASRVTPEKGMNTVRGNASLSPAQPGNTARPKPVFSAEGSGYDYDTARRAGITPDASGHWPSRVELPPEKAKALGLPPGSGVILKGRGHETFDKTVQGEKQAGYQIIKLGDRYYSIPGSADLGKVARQHQIATSDRIRLPKMPKVGPLPHGQGLPKRY